MHPLELGGDETTNIFVRSFCLYVSLISLQEEAIVFGNLSVSLRWKKIKFDLLKSLDNFEKQVCIT